MGLSLFSIKMAVDLTDEELCEIKEAFNMFDKDGSGSITTRELGNVLKSLGQCPSEEDLADMIKRIDINGDGEVDFDEFVEMMKHQMSDDPLSDEDLQRAFDQIDEDGSGFISKDELKKLMQALDCAVDDEELNEMMAKADTDGDGEITFEEFKALLQHPGDQPEQQQQK